MKIEGPFGVQGSPARVRRVGAGRAQDSFADHLSAETTGLGAGPAVTLGAIPALVAIQEVPDATDGRRAANVRYGHDLLDELETLKLALVTGRVEGKRLATIADMVRLRKSRCDDPVLASLLSEIELRAEVELAKLGRAV